MINITNINPQECSTFEDNRFICDILNIHFVRRDSKIEMILLQIRKIGYRLKIGLFDKSRFSELKKYLIKGLYFYLDLLRIHRMINEYWIDRITANIDSIEVVVTTCICKKEYRFKFSFLYNSYNCTYGFK